MKFHPSRNAFVILLKILSCLSVKTNLHWFCKRHQEIQLFSTILWGARIEVSLDSSWVVLPVCLLKAFTSPIVGEAAFGAHPENLYQHWNCVLLCKTHLSVLEGFCTLYALLECSGDLFVFLSTGISSNSSMNFCWLTSMLGPDRRSLIQRILCPVKSMPFHSSEPTWKCFL